MKRGTRARIQVLTLVFVLVGVITIAGNIALAVNKKAIGERILGSFTHDISVGPVFYVFPNRVIAANIIIQKNTPSLGQSSFALSRIEIHFSLWKWLTAGRLRISGVTVYPGDVRFYALSLFLKDNYQKISEIIKNASGRDLKIQVKEALLNFTQKGNSDDVAAEFLLTVRGGSFEGAGLVRADRYQSPVRDGGGIRRASKGWPLRYKFQGRLNQDGFEMDHFIVKSGSRYGKLWGSVHGGILKVNGFMFAGAAKQNMDEWGHSFARYFKDFPMDNDLANINVYILDIDGQANFLFPEIRIEKFNFAVNNIPVTLRGDISLLDPFAFEVTVSVRRPSPDKDAFFETADMTLTGERKDKALDMDGQMTIRFSKNSGLSFSPESARVIFQGLRYQNAHIRLGDCDIAYRVNDNAHRISIRDFNAELKEQRKGFKVIEYHAPFYEGRLNGELYIDSTHIPSQITSQMTLEDVRTDALEELLIHFAKFNGRMSSAMNFTNIPRFEFNGKVLIEDGRMTDFKFFDWVGDSFRLPALKAIGFGQASAQFSMNSGHARLFDIRLKTEDVRIRGYFDVNNQNFVSSKLTIALSQGLLRQSPKFKPVLTVFENDKAPLDFEFQLSGNIDAMNFQWLPSQVKRKIQKHIPDFVERLIEKNIDEMMEPVP